MILWSVQSNTSYVKMVVTGKICYYHFVFTNNSLSAEGKEETNNALGVNDAANVATVVSKVNGVAVEVIINADGSKVVRAVNSLVNPTPYLPGGNSTINLVDDALHSGAAGVKALTGAKTVSQGKTVLAITQTAGKIGNAAGTAGTILTPFIELDTSMSIFEEDLALIAQYGTEAEIREAVIWGSVAAVTDSGSWGFGRAVAKTPSALVRLLPGEDPAWTNSWDSAVNEYGNSRSFHENVISPIWQKNYSVEK